MLAHILFKGHVQGVGFRYQTQNFADQLGLHGWVKNLSDGRVECMCEGSRKQIDNLCQMLSEHFGKKIHECLVTFNNDSKHYQSFDIRY